MTDSGTWITLYASNDAEKQEMIEALRPFCKRIYELREQAAKKEIEYMKEDGE